MGTLVRQQVVEGIGRMTLADPAHRNVLSAGLVEQARAAHAELLTAGVRVAVLDAEGPVFCAGRDPEFVRVPGTAPAGATLLDELDASPLTWVAAVGGAALGAGVHLMANCHYVLLAAGATVAVPELAAGVYPRPVAAALAAVIGPRRALHLVLAGAELDAAEAVGLGLANEAVPAAELADRAFAVARRLHALGEPLLAAVHAAWADRLGMR